MSKRLFAILSLIAALGLGTPALLAAHGDKGSKHKHEGKHFDDDDQGWNDVTGTSIAFTKATISVPQDGVVERRLDRVIADCLLAKLRNMAVKVTFMRGVLTTTIRTTRDRLSFVGQSLKFTPRWTSTDRIEQWGNRDGQFVVSPLQRSSHSPTLEVQLV